MLVNRLWLMTRVDWDTTRHVLLARAICVVRLASLGNTETVGEVAPLPDLFLECVFDLMHIKFLTIAMDPGA